MNTNQDQTKTPTPGSLEPVGSESGRVERFAFNLAQRVIIREVQRPGTIEALTIDFLGVQYRVAYWDNSERKTVWLHADELEQR